MLDAIPDLEFEKIQILWKYGKDLIETLLQKSIYKTRQELFKVLQFDDICFYIDKSMTYEYFSTMTKLEDLHINQNVKQVGLMILSRLKKDLSFD